MFVGWVLKLARVHYSDPSGGGRSGALGSTLDMIHNG